MPQMASSSLRMIAKMACKGFFIALQEVLIESPDVQLLPLWYQDPISDAVAGLARSPKSIRLLSVFNVGFISKRRSTPPRPSGPFFVGRRLYLMTDIERGIIRQEQLDVLSLLQSGAGGKHAVFQLFVENQWLDRPFEHVGEWVDANAGG